MTPPAPLWSVIRATLGAEIAAGQYRPGDRLPTEAALAARFGVNRHTVRRALGDLAAAGLVVSRRGAGVFVADRPADYPLGPRVRFARNLAAAGRLPGRRFLAIETRRADPDEAEALGLDCGAAVHCADGLSLADGQPIAIFRSVFPAARLPGLPGALRSQGSVTGALQMLGVADYTRAQTRISAQTADASQAAHLHLVAGAALLRSVAVNLGPDGRPIEYGTTWFAGSRVTLTLNAGT